MSDVLEPQPDAPVTDPLTPAPVAWIVDDLARSGLSVDQVKAAGILGQEFNRTYHNELLGYSKFAGHGISVTKSYFILYQNIAGEAPDYHYGRLKLHGTLGGAKYLSPKKGHIKHTSHLYITNSEVGKLQSPKRPLLIVEGEKKALAVSAALAAAGLDKDYCTIGVAGIRQWQTAPEWSKLKIRLRGRDIFVVFDADCADNADVRQEQLKLLAWGLEHGSRVFLVNWPVDQGKGIDDFLVAGGALPDLLTAATSRKYLEFFKNRPVTEIIDAFRRIKMGRITTQTLAINIRQYWGDIAKSLLIKELLNEKETAASKAAKKEAETEARTWPERAQEYIKTLKNRSGQLMLRRWNGSYFVYRGANYTQIEDELAMAERQDFLGRKYPDLATVAGNKNLEINLTRTIFIDNSKDKTLPCWLTSHGAKIQIEPKTRPDPDSVIPLENGLLVIASDGKTSELLPHTPDFFSINCLPFAYDAAAECPIFREFISESVEPAYQHLLQEFGGLCMTPITRFQRFVLLYGDGGNGKGVFTNILSAVIGKDNISNLPIEALNQNLQHIEGIVGKLVNLTGEIRIRADIDEGTLKAITGDDSISINPKYKKPYDYTPRCKLLFSANKMITFPDKSNAIWRRMMPIPFNNIPTKINMKLEKQLKETELPGIFNWFIEGLTRLLTNNEFTIPDEMMLDIINRKKASDPVLMFLSDYVEETPGGLAAKVHAADFYQAYDKWCKLNGHNKFSFSSTGFLDELNRICKRGVSRKPLQFNGAKAKCFAFEPRALDALHKRLVEFAEADEQNAAPDDIPF